jgi:cohesin complex subunit SCC1
VVKEIIADAKDLVCTRRKAPHTYLDAWKVAKIGSLQDTFMDPLIQCKSIIHLVPALIIDENLNR